MYKYKVFSLPSSPFSVLPLQFVKSTRRKKKRGWDEWISIGKKKHCQLKCSSWQSPESRTAHTVFLGIEVIEDIIWKEERKFSVETSFWEAQGSRPCSRITEVRCAWKSWWNKVRQKRQNFPICPIPPSGYMNAISNEPYHALKKKQCRSFLIVLEVSSNDAFARQHNWIFIF